MAEEDMDFSGLDGMDDIDWSDVAADLEKNREMIHQEADGGEGGETSDFGEGDGGEAGRGEGGGGIEDSEVGIEFLMDIPLQFRVEVGTADMYVKDLLSVDVESVFELRKNVGEPMEIKINDKLVAKGEIIIQNEKFGIKITEIMDKKDRLNALL